MAISYDWNISTLKKTTANNLSGVVIGTNWICIGTDEQGDTGSFPGATPFSQVDPETFIPFENLTKEIVMSWIQTSVTGSVWDSAYPPETANGSYWIHIENQIQKQIDSKKNPVIDVNDFPWDQSTNT